MCTDLQCSLYVRGLLTSDAAHPMNETLSVEEKIDRLRTRLDRFTRDVIGAQPLEAL
jgi:hypothetical protein